uniref:Uncharacterized protein n=1 Tax=Anguilla anguilla TaxID=7936 RepID=A0A0E9VH47_ANGAN
MFLETGSTCSTFTTGSSHSLRLTPCTSVGACSCPTYLCEACCSDVTALISLL